MMKRLFKQVQGTRKLMAISVGLGAAGGLLLIVQAVYMARIVGGAFLSGLDLTSLLPPLGVLLAIIGVRALLQGTGDYAASAMAQRIKSRLRLRLVSKLSELGPEYGKGERSGELVGTVYEGIEQLESYLSKYLPQLAISMFVPVAVFCMTVTVDRLSAIVFAVTMPLLILFMILIGISAKAKTDKQFKLLGRLGGHFHDVLRGLPTLAMFNRSKAQIDIIARIGDEHRRSTMGTLRLAFLSALAMELFASLSTAVVAVFLGLRLVDGEIGFEAAFLVLLLAPEFYTPIRTLGTQFHAGQNGISALARMVKILDAEPAGWTEREGARTLPDRPEGYRIAFESVSYRRASADRDAVEELSFVLEPGERVALVGPSGAGKSTVLELLQGYIRPTSGRILIDGIDMAELSMADWRRRLSALPQRAHLFAGTVVDNIRLSAPEASEAEVVEAARASQADRFIRRLPHGYETELGEALRLSGGQAQRVALARTLLRRSPLLLLDEPTSGLDAMHEAALLDAVEPALAERMSITVAHRLYTIHRATRVLVLAEGRLAEQGSPSQLLAAGGLYARLWQAAGAEEADAAGAGRVVSAPEEADGVDVSREHAGSSAAGMSANGGERVVSAPEQRPAAVEPAAVLGSDGAAGLRAVASSSDTETRPGGRNSAAQRESSSADVADVAADAANEPAEASTARVGIADTRSDRSVLVRLLGFVRPYKWRLLAAVLIGFLTVAANAGLMGVSGYLIAKAALRPENILLLYVPIVGVRFFGIARGVLRYVERLVSHDLTFRILQQLRTWLYTRLEPQGARLLERQRSGDLLSSVLSDVEQLQNLYLRVIAPPAIAVLAAMLGSIALGLAAPSLGWTLLAMMALTGIVVPWAGHRFGRRGARDFVAARARLYEETSDLLSGMEPLTLYGRSGWQTERIDAVQAELDRHQRSQHRIAAVTGGLMNGLAHLTTWLILAMAIPLTASGALPGYMIPALMLAAFACFEAILPLPQAFQQYGQTMAAGERLLRLADEASQLETRGRAGLTSEALESRTATAQLGAARQPAASTAVAASQPDVARQSAADPLTAQTAAQQPALAASAGMDSPQDMRAVEPAAAALSEAKGSLTATAALSQQVDSDVAARTSPVARLSSLTAWRADIRGLGFRYDADEAYALRDIDLSLASGRQVAVVGESGAGKSTLIRLLLKLRDYEEGSISLQGRELSTMTAEEGRSQFAVVSQQVQLFNATVADNLRLGRPDAPMEVLREAARIAMLEPVIDKLPQGYDTIVGEWGARLSGGERQRLALARALVLDAPALLFDEPGTGLDPLTELAFGEKLRPLLAGKAALWVTHRLAGLETMDEILVLQDGRVCERGTHAELIRTRGAYYRMWRLQQQEAWARVLA